MDGLEVQASRSHHKESGMNVGFIGLGNIGKPMALNVVGAGHRTAVHDIRPEAATD